MSGRGRTPANDAGSYGKRRKPAPKQAARPPFPHTHANHISMYLHCGLCADKMPPDAAPRDWARLNVGWTPWGLQVWCTRCNANVMHMDFDGARHRADMRSDPDQ